ncbi:hypothetical protein JTB14_018990 [Gonioctena quinquepunctata]|nr:hypothetical protein JTB14_018990 [Gonioctena quinquepunctata]
MADEEAGPSGAKRARIPNKWYNYNSEKDLKELERMLMESDDDLHKAKTTKQSLPPPPRWSEDTYSMKENQFTKHMEFLVIPEGNKPIHIFDMLVDEIFYKMIVEQTNRTRWYYVEVFVSTGELDDFGGKNHAANVVLNLMEGRLDPDMQSLWIIITMVTTLRSTVHTQNILHRGLQTVKDTVKGNSAAKSIRRTKDGKFHLTLDKDSKALENISPALKNDGQKAQKPGQNHVRRRQLTPKEEIVEAVKEITGIWNADCKTSGTRPMQNDTCRVENRLGVNKCTKYWSYYHTKEKCTGPDRTKSCYKYGKGEHNVNECNNLEYCPECDMEGHRLGTNKCKAFKDALKGARHREIRRTKIEIPEGAM